MRLDIEYYDGYYFIILCGNNIFYYFEAIEQAVQNLNNKYGVLVALID